MNVSGDGYNWNMAGSSVMGETQEFLICSNSDFAPTSHLPVQLFWRLGLIFLCTSVLVHKPEHCSS